MKALERYFRLKELGGTVGREVVAGVTTFAAMAYILAVNPQILAAGGMDTGAVLTATALASALMTFLMALMTNYPIALAPGMGLNAFFAFTLCGSLGLPWQAALGIVFYSGILFFLLSVTGLRKRLLEGIPFEMKIAIAAAIGFFIAFIGLQNAGIVVASPATLVTLGKMSQPKPLLALFGILLTGALVLRRVPGAVILGILLLTFLGLFLPDETGKKITAMPPALIGKPASLAPTFLQLDLAYFWKHFHALCLPLLALLFVDLFDNMGTLIGVTQRAGFLDKDGNLPKIQKAFMADAAAAMIGSTLGTSTVTSYIESSAGVEEGGRSGLAAIVTGICFLLALFLTPLILVIPAVATAPALVVVGAFMMQGIKDLDLKDFTKALPAFVTIVMMPLTFSISEGLAMGLITFAGVKLLAGRGREVSPLVYGLAALFLVHYLTGGIR
jgi:AGZA family xanthine/uracil permease-like MFS transporter